MTHRSVGVSFGRLTAAVLNSSCAALSEMTRPAHNKASERREPDLDKGVSRKMELGAFLLIMTGVAIEVIAQVAFKRGAMGAARATGESGVLHYWRDLV